MQESREDGWYWVLTSEGSEWECSKYDDGKFYLAAWGWVYENELLEIGERITREVKVSVKDEHVHEWIHITSFGYSYCSCGDVMSKEGRFTKEEIEAIRKNIKIPGNTFEV